MSHCVCMRFPSIATDSDVEVLKCSLYFKLPTSIHKPFTSIHHKTSCASLLCKYLQSHKQDPADSRPSPGQESCLNVEISRRCEMLGTVAPFIRACFLCHHVQQGASVCPKNAYFASFLLPVRMLAKQKIETGESVCCFSGCVCRIVVCTNETQINPQGGKSSRK